MLHKFDADLRDKIAKRASGSQLGCLQQGRAAARRSDGLDQRRRGWCVVATTPNNAGKTAALLGSGD